MVGANDLRVGQRIPFYVELTCVAPRPDMTGLRRSELFVEAFANGDVFVGSMLTLALLFFLLSQNAAQLLVGLNLHTLQRSVGAAIGNVADAFCCGRGCDVLRDSPDRLPILQMLGCQISDELRMTQSLVRGVAALLGRLQKLFVDKSVRAIELRQSRLLVLPPTALASTFPATLWV